MTTTTIKAGKFTIQQCIPRQCLNLANLKKQSIITTTMTIQLKQQSTLKMVCHERNEIKAKITCYLCLFDVLFWGCYFNVKGVNHTPTKQILTNRSKIGIFFHLFTFMFLFVETCYCCCVMRWD